MDKGSENIVENNHLKVTENLSIETIRSPEKIFNDSAVVVSPSTSDFGVIIENKDPALSVMSEKNDGPSSEVIFTEDVLDQPGTESEGTLNTSDNMKISDSLSDCSSHIDTDNTSDYESAGSAKLSTSVQSVSEVQFMEKETQIKKPIGGPALLENAFNMVKNLFSPDRTKVSGKPKSASTPVKIELLNDEEKTPHIKVQPTEQHTCVISPNSEASSYSSHRATSDLDTTVIHGPVKQNVNLSFDETLLNNTLDLDMSELHHQFQRLSLETPPKISDHSSILPETDEESYTSTVSRLDEEKTPHIKVQPAEQHTCAISPSNSEGSSNSSHRVTSDLDTTVIHGPVRQNVDLSFEETLLNNTLDLDLSELHHQFQHLSLETPLKISDHSSIQPETDEESYTSTVSRIDDSFKSTITHFEVDHLKLNNSISREFSTTTNGKIIHLDTTFEKIEENLNEGENNIDVNNTKDVIQSTGTTSQGNTNISNKKLTHDFSDTCSNALCGNVNVSYESKDSDENNAHVVLNKTQTSELQELTTSNLRSEKSSVSEILKGLDNNHSLNVDSDNLDQIMIKDSKNNSAEHDLDGRDNGKISSTKNENSVEKPCQSFEEICGLTKINSLETLKLEPNLAVQTEFIPAVYNAQDVIVKDLSLTEETNKFSTLVDTNLNLGTVTNVHFSHNTNPVHMVSEDCIKDFGSEKSYNPECLNRLAELNTSKVCTSQYVIDKMANIEHSDNAIQGDSLNLAAVDFELNVDQSLNSDKLAEPKEPHQPILNVITNLQDFVISKDSKSIQDKINTPMTLEHIVSDANYNLKTIVTEPSCNSGLDLDIFPKKSEIEFKSEDDVKSKSGDNIPEENLLGVHNRLNVTFQNKREISRVGHLDKPDILTRALEISKVASDDELVKNRDILNEIEFQSVEETIVGFNVDNMQQIKTDILQISQDTIKSSDPSVSVIDVNNLGKSQNSALEEYNDSVLNIQDISTENMQCNLKKSVISDMTECSVVQDISVGSYTSYTNSNTSMEILNVGDNKDEKQRTPDNLAENRIKEDGVFKISLEADIKCDSGKYVVSNLAEFEVSPTFNGNCVGNLATQGTLETSVYVPYNTDFVQTVDPNSTECAVAKNPETVIDTENNTIEIISLGSVEITNNIEGPIDVRDSTPNDNSVLQKLNLPNEYTLNVLERSEGSDDRNVEKHEWSQLQTDSEGTQDIVMKFDLINHPPKELRSDNNHLDILQENPVSVPYGHQEVIIPTETKQEVIKATNTQNSTLLKNLEVTETLENETNILKSDKRPLPVITNEEINTIKEDYELSYPLNIMNKTFDIIIDGESSPLSSRQCDLNKTFDTVLKSGSDSNISKMNINKEVKALNEYNMEEKLPTHTINEKIINPCVETLKNLCTNTVEKKRILTEVVENKLNNTLKMKITPSVDSEILQKQVFEVSDLKAYNKENMEQQSCKTSISQLSRRSSSCEKEIKIQEKLNKDVSLVEQNRLTEDFEKMNKGKKEEKQNETSENVKVTTTSFASINHVENQLDLTEQRKICSSQMSDINSKDFQKIFEKQLQALLNVNEGSSHSNSAGITSKEKEETLQNECGSDSASKDCSQKDKTLFIHSDLYRKEKGNQRCNPDSLVDIETFIQEQFTSSDIETICRVVVNKTPEQIRDKVGRASQEFKEFSNLSLDMIYKDQTDKLEKFHESPTDEVTSTVENISPGSTGIGDDGLKEQETDFIFQSPESFDFLNSIKSFSSGRDLSKESLYVKFDPLVGPPKDFNFSVETNPSIEKTICEPSNINTPPKFNKDEQLINISPLQKQPVSIVNPMFTNKTKIESVTAESSSAPDEVSVTLQKEISRLNNLLQTREKIYQDQMNAFESQISQLTGDCYLLEDKLKSSQEREKSLVKRLNEQRQDFAQIKLVMTLYEETISKLTRELENLRKQYEIKVQSIISEKDSLQCHLDNLETAFTDVHTKYEKAKRSVEDYKKNEITMDSTINDQKDEILHLEKKIEMIKARSATEIEKLNKEMISMGLIHEQEIGKLTATLRKTDLKLVSVQETLNHTVKENQALTTLCDEIIAGKKS